MDFAGEFDPAISPSEIHNSPAANPDFLTYTQPIDETDVQKNGTMGGHP